MNVTGDEHNKLILLRKDLSVTFATVERSWYQIIGMVRKSLPFCT